MSFLPKDYEGPKQVSRYWNKWEKGKNRFRALGDAVVGWEYWIEDEAGNRSPVRVKIKEEVLDEYKSGGEDDARFFWMFPVWNYQEEAIQILSIKQITIQNYLEDFYNNPDWGDLKQYDITVVRKGEGFDTEYTVTPSPAKELDESVQEKFEQMDIDMQALYENEDPFGSREEEVKKN